MKHIARYILFLLLFISIPCLLSADTLSLTTYYPAPFGSYSVLRLNPNSDASMGACDASKTGQFYLSSDSNEIKLCKGTVWEAISPWKLDSTSKYVYQEQSVTDTDYKVGIGVAAPTARLHIKGIDDAVYGQLQVESSENDAKINLLNSSGATTSGNASIAMSNTAGSEGLRFLINNSDTMIVDENGNLGLGLTEPNTRLHINGPDSAAYGQLEVQSTGNDARLSLYNANNASATGRGDIMMSRTAGSEGLRFLINNSDKMIIDENGNVGIGDVAPPQSLSIRKDQNSAETVARVANLGTTANTLAGFQLMTGTTESWASSVLMEVGASSSYYALKTGDGVTSGLRFVSGSTINTIPIVFQQGPAERMRVDSTGNVGIGVVAPVKKLDVAGGLHLSGPISGNLDSANPGSAGELQVDCVTTPGKCYAVYAP